MAFFGGFWLRPLPPFNLHCTLIFLEEKRLKWYICHVSFIYIWLVISEFSYFKCFWTRRKYYFRLLLGGFLDVTPWNLFEILTTDAMQSNASDIWQFLFNCKEMVEIEPKNWFSGVFSEVFVIIIIIINKYLYRANSSIVILYTKLYTIYKLLSWRPCKT